MARKKKEVNEITIRNVGCSNHVLISGWKGRRRYIYLLIPSWVSESISYPKSHFFESWIFPNGTRFGGIWCFRNRSLEGSFDRKTVDTHIYLQHNNWLVVFHQPIWKKYMRNRQLGSWNFSRASCHHYQPDLKNSLEVVFFKKTEEAEPFSTTSWSRWPRDWGLETSKPDWLKGWWPQSPKKWQSLKANAFGTI